MAVAFYLCALKKRFFILHFFQAYLIRAAHLNYFDPRFPSDADLYCPGVTPIILLKTRQNAFDSEKPTSTAISPTDADVARSNVAALLTL